MPTPDRPATLAPEYEKIRSTQDYSAKPRIEGVVVKELRRFVEDGGEFQELARLTDGGELPEFPGFKVRQINYSVMETGVVKAWHLHLTQEDVWFVPPGSKLVVGLLDCRDDSPTKGLTMRLVMGEGRSQLLYIPRGVAHGAANLSGRSGVVVYLVNQHFNANRPDEQRLPWDAAGPDFWRLIIG